MSHQLTKTKRVYHQVEI